MQKSKKTTVVNLQRQLKALLENSHEKEMEQIIGSRENYQRAEKLAI